MSNERRNPINALFDEEDFEPIILFNQNGEEISFEKIALIPLKEKMYVILKTVIPMEGLKENEGLVFSIELNEETNEEYLLLTIDEQIIDEVFNAYERLIDSQN